ncbi:universal stress protein [Kitasatospora camelliae]|uniref:Universal stress protein n=1 Tax=Kitasatospora camelliae TaxID=3156397 RepID=A0AAU8JS67_9ACTN
MGSASERRPIVLGIDAVDATPMAVAWAADEAARRGLPLRLVHAVPPASREIRGYEESRYQEALRRTADEALDKASLTARERHPDLHVVTALADGRPGQVLSRESHHAELVVLGSRGMSRLEELLSAYSVTVPVTAQAHCPVAVVRAPEHTTENPPYLVVGVDGSPSAAAAVDFAFDQAALRGAELRAVWAWQSTLIAHLDEEGAIATLRRLLAETTAGRSATHPDVTVSHEVVRGHPVEVLSEAGRHALAVVVGRRGRGGWTGMRLGSVPHGLLHRAPCPVIVAPSVEDERS